jgi:hypothetical protein
MDLVSNQSLYDKKLKTLEFFKNNFNSGIFDCSFVCSYHGIGLNIYSQSNNLKNCLVSFIPPEWLDVENYPIEIYLLDPKYFGYSLEGWCDEASQDCYSMANNQVAIQRDFASWIISHNKVLLICENTVGDGFYNFLRWFISERLILQNKYVVHSSCVLDKNNLAHLFLGHSGAGKTTITKLSVPRLTLGDDMNIVSVNGEDLMVEAGAIGGIFNSMIGYDIKIKVKACYWLAQARENKLKILSPLSANQKLLASFANLHWASLPPDTADKLISFAIKATSTTEFYELQFKNDSAIWEMLDT